MVVGFYTTNNLVISKDKKTWEALNMGVLESDIQIAIEKELPNIATDEIKKLSELCNDKSNKQLLWLRGVNCKKILISSHSNGPQ